MDDSVRRRLREAIDASGVTDRKASLAAGLNPTYVAQVFNKKQGKLDLVMRVVKAVCPEHLDYVMYGRGKPPQPKAVPSNEIDLIPRRRRIDQSLIPSKIPVLGLAGAGPHGSVIFVDGGVLGYVAVPPGGSDKTGALEVRGDSMKGVANNGWYVYYDDLEDGFREENIGEMCLVEIEDGSQLIKFVHFGTAPGRYNLESTSAPPMRNQVIVRSAFITCALPSRMAKRVTFMEDLD